MVKHSSSDEGFNSSGSALVILDCMKVVSTMNDRGHDLTRSPPRPRNIAKIDRAMLGVQHRTRKKQLGSGEYQVRWADIQPTAPQPPQLNCNA